MWGRGFRLGDVGVHKEEGVKACSEREEDVGGRTEQKL